jgi:membrane protein DedA with SNARE-associated domain
MLPLLLFEFAWKAIWMIAYGLPQWSAGQYPPTFAEDMFNIAFGVVIVPLALPWGYVWRRYVKQPTESWK